MRLKAFHRVETWSCGVPSSRETDIGLKSHILDTSASAAAMKGKVLLLTPPSCGLTVHICPVNLPQISYLPVNRSTSHHADIPPRPADADNS